MNIPLLRGREHLETSPKVKIWENVSKLWISTRKAERLVRCWFFFSSLPPTLPCLCRAPNTFRLLSAKNNTVKLNDHSCKFVGKFKTKHQCKLSVLSELNVLSRTHSRLVLGKVCRQNLTASSEPFMEKGPCQAELACAGCAS